MKKSKQQQEIYRPGSGPLRKSNTPNEDTESDIKHKGEDESKFSKYDSKKKMKKPEQSFYVPRMVAQARVDDQKTPKSYSPPQNGNFENRSKRYYSNRRRTNDCDEWRQFHQGSEPRQLSRDLEQPREKTRDTRSVEPRSFIQPPHSKPPTGRRHSICLEQEKRQKQIDKLPPRLRKKLLEEKNLNQNSLLEDWDGTSLTFQGNNYNNQNLFYCTLPNRARGRGRFNPDFRSRTPDYMMQPQSPTFSRNSRPESPILFGSANSRPQSPAFSKNSRPQSPITNRHYDTSSRRTSGRWDSRENTPPKSVSSLEAQLSPITPESPPPTAKPHSLYFDGDYSNVDSKTVCNSSDNFNKTVADKQILTAIDTAAVLDWSEEVELNDRLEAEAFSDAALTRSSSITSLADAGKGVDIVQNKESFSGKKSKRRSGKRNKRRSVSRARDRSADAPRTGNYQQDIVKTASDSTKQRNRRQSRERRDSSYDRSEKSYDRNRRSSSIASDSTNWREECIRNRQNTELCRLSSDEKGINMKKGGVIVLPTPVKEAAKYPTYPVDARKCTNQCLQKSLFDPNNPDKPIIVKAPSSRINVPNFSNGNNSDSQGPPQMYTTDQYGNIRPAWYDENSEGFKMCHTPNLIRDIKRADADLQYITNSGYLLVQGGAVEQLRQFLKESLHYLLTKELKFCQSENVEQHIWKMLYHNIIEITRKAITTDSDKKIHYKEFLLHLIDEGTKYFEDLLVVLEESYKFKLVDYLGVNNHHKGKAYVGLALISAQKLFLFLGDLGRYREQVNETSNYGKCRQWYIKAQEINPKNGRPYNQLALLAVSARRKLDAVYYYMRSLMSSNPVPRARECLISLLDENRRKYEQGEKKRHEERLEKARLHMKEKESEETTPAPGSLRHETWIRPDGGKRVHRTTQAVQENKDSEDEDLVALSSVEVNKRFVISYLHVHGKLINRTGMESFQEAAMQMLKEFRALLQQSPVPLPHNRFLQLLALNMFAIESTHLKDPELQSQSGYGYRSEPQERALVISLQMFNLILEKCISLLQDYVESSEKFSALPQDIHILLPAIKIWCDWMLCHSSVWNPPPSTQDFCVGTPGDAWTRLAVLMNLLQKLCRNREWCAISQLTEEERSGYDLIRLPEDAVLNGFTPLMVNEPDPSFAPKELDSELAQFSLRLNKLLFFGTVFLCGLEPPVLKLEIEDDFREYVSVVCTSSSRDSPPAPQELKHKDILIERFSSDEDDNSSEELNITNDAPREIRDLLNRKVELERKHKKQELHMQTVKKILNQSMVAVHIEVRPKYLVPDTNCFIDYLNSIIEITASHVYTLMVPIIVLSELEGLSKGGNGPIPKTRSSLDPQHVIKVAQAAKLSLNFLKSKPQGVKCVTTKGAILSSTTFTTEDDSNLDNVYKNDDKILVTCLALSKNNKEYHQDGEPKKLISEVVLLTDDRNLRVKALAQDLPVRELTDFMKWAGLG